MLFRTRRVGEDGRAFELLKYRTMELPSSLDEYADTAALLDRADTLVTPVGRILRRSSLDELPQLFNVVRGDLSLVGPRPLLPDEFVPVEKAAIQRLKLRPGMTGPWQLGPTRDYWSVPAMARKDFQYVKDWSLWRDCKIVVLTVREVLRGHPL